MTQLQEFLDALATSHRIRVRTYVLNANETVQQDISDVVISGQVNLDTSSRPDRTLELTILDADNRLAVLSPHSPALGGLWAGSLIRVYYDVFVESLNSWVASPVFTGPVTQFARDSSQVTINAAGKESLLQSPNYYEGVFSISQITRPDSYRRSALTALLNAVGEPQKVNWQAGTGKLPKSYDARRDFTRGQNSYLALVHDIVGSGNHFFYNGYGTPVVRPRASEATGIDLTPYIVTEISSSFDVTLVRNMAAAHVAGKTLHGLEIVQIVDNNPLSAKSLARGGVPRNLNAGVADGTYKTVGEAHTAAEGMLRGTGLLSVTFDSIPLPFVQPSDIFTATNSAGTQLTFPIQQFSLPLGPEDTMSVGYTRQVLDPRNSRARFRRRRAKHGTRHK